MSTFSSSSGSRARISQHAKLLPSTMNSLAILEQTHLSAEPSTQIADFDKIAFWWRFGPNTEVRTVYFPALLPSETREAVERLKGLVLTMGIDIDGSKAYLSPHNGVPTCGWAEGSQTWMNQDTVACLWCHYWKDLEAEEKFKMTETRPPRDGEEARF
ncbi:hypothetical protein F4801DRAFT_543976 [Xylaria longipes]|nr:hypothetical protein F4801DRAFT_543976 [Xylaria longipes]RYC54024.1 hypothetical protein CHU98_g12184 [Xylaria longipes]